jgi:hyperosmotically inducible periplasmic protein
MRTRLRRGVAALLLATAATSVVTATQNGATPAAPETTTRVQRALQRLPYYGVFDFLAFSIDRGTVTLRGYAYRGNLKSEAVQALRRVEGVEEVVDRIELLPSSPHDETIRWATFSTLYGDSALSRYIPGGEAQQRYDFGVFARFPNMQPVGMYPVHIIVKGLHTTLVGMVDNELDKTVASTRARQVPGVLGVDVDIAVAQPKVTRRAG